MVEDYVANGMEILPTITTATGKSYGRGNFFNTTKGLTIPRLGNS